MHIPGYAVVMNKYAECSTSGAITYRALKRTFLKVLCSYYTLNAIYWLCSCT